MAERQTETGANRPVSGAYRCIVRLEWEDSAHLITLQTARSWWRDRAHSSVRSREWKW